MPKSGAKPQSARRILVTGSRGKSSIVRLLHAALQGAGLQSFARITGVAPRELGPEGTRRISRSVSAHVEEMRWWLKQLPSAAQAIVMENSAISPDFQGLAGRWLQPDVTVLSNTLPDHQEVWGPDRATAAEVLTQGVPKAGVVILPASLKTDSYLLELLDQRRCDPRFADPVPAPGVDYQASNMGLALAVVECLGLETVSALQAMRELQSDKYEFSVVNCGGAELAMAFSANDIASTRKLFHTLSWPEDGTRLVYNHRRDRPGRLRSFLDWLNQSSWREVMIIGDKPRMSGLSAQYERVKSAGGLLRLFKPGDRIFGCGNIAGLPMALVDVLDQQG